MQTSAAARQFCAINPAVFHELVSVVPTEILSNRDLEARFWRAMYNLYCHCTQPPTVWEALEVCERLVNL